MSLKDNDTVVFSSTPIPGNEASVYKVVNALCMNGVHVFRAPHDQVHVSGHGNREDLKQMLELCKPEFAIPYHGEPRHALAYADLCEELGIARATIPFLQVGDVLSIKPGHIDIIGQAPAGSVLVDGLTIGDVGYSVLRDRKHLADDGVVVATVILDKKSGAILSGPDITQRGAARPGECGVSGAGRGEAGGPLQGMAGGISDENGLNRIAGETLSDNFSGAIAERAGVSAHCVGSLGKEKTKQCPSNAGRCFCWLASQG